MELNEALARLAKGTATDEDRNVFRSHLANGSNPIATHIKEMHTLECQQIEVNLTEALLAGQLRWAEYQQTLGLLWDLQPIALANLRSLSPELKQRQGPIKTKFEDNWVVITTEHPNIAALLRAGEARSDKSITITRIAALLAIYGY